MRSDPIPPRRPLRGHSRMRIGRPGLMLTAVGLALLSAPLSAPAQEADEAFRERLRESQDRLSQIRGEREQLRRQLDELTSQVHTVSEEIRIIERQIGASASVVSELDVQLGTLLDQVSLTTSDMLLTRDRLTVRRVVLQQRLREIYKRGALAPVEVLLAADSFSDLLNRYKYLHQVALFDRLLVREVSRLERDIEEQRARLSEELRQVERLRDEKSRELVDLEHLERQRQNRLRGVTQQRTQAQSRLTQLAQEEERLRNTIAELERARREAERRTGLASVSTLRTSDIGQLNWPVEGNILYQFGPEREGSSTTMREGIGIGAPVGTPVRAVEAGRVLYAGPRNLYGQSVIVGHGGGYYTVYLYMQSLQVTEGEDVRSGQVIGTVGGAATPEGPHVEFQIHEPSGGGAPRAVDPVRWLRGQP